MEMCMRAVSSFGHSSHVHVLLNVRNAGLYCEMDNANILRHGGTIMREQRGGNPCPSRHSHTQHGLGSGDLSTWRIFANILRARSAAAPILE